MYESIDKSVRDVIESEPSFEQPSDTDMNNNDTNLGEAMIIPAELMKPLVLRDLAGMPWNMICKMLDLPPGTVKSRVNRGRKKMNEVSQELTDEPSPQKNMKEVRESVTETLKELKLAERRLKRRG
jgi:DNA-directed RNA polymerase specialized sigma24 family protein